MSRTWRSINSRLASFTFARHFDNRVSHDHIDNTLASEMLCELLYDSRSLKRLRLKVCVEDCGPFVVDPRPEGRQSSIEHLSLCGLLCHVPPLLEVLPALQSLDLGPVQLPFDPEPVPHSLNTLRHLTVRLGLVSLHRIDAMLKPLVHLTHLTLILNNVVHDVANGFVWARLLKSISIFKFVFTFSWRTVTLPAIDLASFRTPFWLDEKHWYVTYERCLETGFAVLYSDPYCRYDYPFYCTKDGIIRVSTSLHPTPLPPMKYIRADCPSPSELRSFRRFSLGAPLALDECGSTLQSKLDYAREHLQLSHISDFGARECVPDIPSDTFVKFIQSMPRLRSLGLCISLLKKVLVGDWPHIRHLRIMANQPARRELLTLTDVDAVVQSFKHLEQLAISSDAFDDVSLLLNRTETMTMLAEIVIESAHKNTHPIVDRDWLEQNTELPPFHYSRSPTDTVTLWLY